MCVLKTDPKASDCLNNGLHRYCLIEVHATNQAIACSLIYNSNLACDKGTRLNCYNVISTASKLDMTIITLGWLYFMLSCRLVPTNVVTVQQQTHRCLTGSHPQLEWAQKLFGPGSLMGFQCEDTWHVVSSNPRSDPDRTNP
jgi:hypothetical protein